MLFTIKDIENLSGIKAHTIRIWEQRYSFLKPQRSETNIRYYTNEDLKTILNISLLNKYGFKVSHLDKMSPEKIAENVLSLSDSGAKDHVTVNRLLECMVDYEVEDFEAVLEECLEVSGMEKTVVRIIFPFLEKVGALWVTNHVNPAQEHLVSNVIRQKILVGIDSLSLKKGSLKKICLFLPSGEYHEIALLLVAYLLKRKDVKVIYLGAHTPFNELEAVVQHHHPDYIYTHITSSSKNFNFENFVITLGKKFKNYPLIVSGRFTEGYKKKIPANVSFMHSLAEVKEFISGI
ncbi:MAG: MerR family transcriptional regulator [Ginsengibacter sp.]